MKYLVPMLFLCLHLQAQDKVFLLDGSCIKAKVEEITPYNVVISGSADRHVIDRYEILLIEFRNGKIENFNAPYEDLVIEEGSALKNPTSKTVPLNFISLNTLALTNSDISCFYEKAGSGRKFGAGAMAAYNFNLYATAQNAFIAVLDNAKKKYDLGVFVNYYTGGLTDHTNFYYGVLLKYTSFSYTRLQDSLGPGNTIRYVKENGSQLATIFNIGTVTFVEKNLFIKTIFGLGGFNLKGRYRKDYNAVINKNNNSNLETGFLPKFYFGLNIGYRF